MFFCPSSSPLYNICCPLVQRALIKPLCKTIHIFTTSFREYMSPTYGLNRDETDSRSTIGKGVKTANKRNKQQIFHGHAGYAFYLLVLVVSHTRERYYHHSKIKIRPRKDFHVIMFSELIRLQFCDVLCKKRQRKSFDDLSKGKSTRKPLGFVSSRIYLQHLTQINVHCNRKNKLVVQSNGNKKKMMSSSHPFFGVLCH